MGNSKTNVVKTVLTISVGFIIVYILTNWNWALFVSVIIGLAGICSDYMCLKIDFVWTKLTQLLGLIVPNIILAIIFYLFLFPISMLSKLFSKTDPLQLKNKGKSTYVTVDKVFEKNSFEKTW